ncbi:MAG: nucleotidyltransferase domain-containing protein [bacterium]
MINDETIEDVKNRLINVYDPLAIYLFGSYAWGTPTEDSDLDILIIVAHSDEKIHKRSLPASLALIDMKIPKDIVVYTKNEFEKVSGDETTLMYKIKKEGTKIYAKA